MYDVVVIGGGPAGLQAALTLARGQRRVIVLDAGTPRNARASHLHNFVTRDGIPPLGFREIARKELAAYDVEVRETRARSVEGEKGGFRIGTDAGEFRARRVLLAGGMIDVLPEIPGFAELWGETIFQCPYCHGHELRGRRWAAFADTPDHLEMAVAGRAWTDDMIAITGGAFPIDDGTRARLARAGIGLDERAIVGIRPSEDDPRRLGGFEMSDGGFLARDALMARPPQRQTELVRALGLVCEQEGCLALDEHRQTSIPGVYAAGDAVTVSQGAVGGAALAVLAAAALNHELTADLLGWTPMKGS